MESFIAKVHQLPAEPPAAGLTRLAAGSNLSPELAQRQALQQHMADLSLYMQQSITLGDLLQTTAAGLRQAIAADVVVLSQHGADGREHLRAIAHGLDLAPGTCRRYFRWGHAIPADLGQIHHLDHSALVQLPTSLRQCLQIQHMDNGWIVPLFPNGQSPNDLGHDRGLWGQLMGFWRSPLSSQPPDLPAWLNLLATQLMVGVKLVDLRQQVYQGQVRQQRLELMVSHIQSHDALTGLPNRQAFLQELACAFRPDLPAQTTGVVLINIDRFQTINDTMGHEVGDQLLLELSHRLTQTLNPIHSLAHWGEDKFAVLLRHLPRADSAQAIAAQLRQAIECPYDCDHTEVFLTACMGIALNQTRHTAADHLLQEADTALHQAKRQGKGLILPFETAMHEQVVARLRLEIALRKALEQGEFVLNYQPIVTLVDQTLVGFEALVRWQHPTLGLISPAEFIPIAEETGLVVAIDHWCLQTACAQMSQWQQRWPHLPPLTIGVNLSSRHFSQPNLVGHIQAHLKAAGVTSDRLKLEITESTLIENTALAASILADLQQLGLQVSMDDFGTGYSSLSYLHQFKLNTLKIDRSFIAPLEPGNDKIAIVQAIITLAHALGMNVVAEGVETSAQHDLLVAMHCEYGQGYLFDRPLTSGDATSTIKRQISQDRY